MGVAVKLPLVIPGLSTTAVPLIVSHALRERTKMKQASRTAWIAPLGIGVMLLAQRDARGGISLLSVTVHVQCATVVSTLNPVLVIA